MCRGKKEKQLKRTREDTRRHCQRRRKGRKGCETKIWKRTRQIRQKRRKHTNDRRRGRILSGEKK